MPLKVRELFRQLVVLFVVEGLTPGARAVPERNLTLAILEIVVGVIEILEHHIALQSNIKTDAKWSVPKYLVW